jgi:hypothetical protein
VRPRSHPLRVARLVRRKIAINLWIPTLISLSFVLPLGGDHPPQRWPDNCTEPAQTSPSSRRLNVGRGTDVGPRFTIAKECICNARAVANNHRAVAWNSAVFFCTVSACVKARQKCESKSRHDPADFIDTPGLAVCDSSRSRFHPSGGLRSRLSLDQPRQEE